MARYKKYYASKYDFPTKSIKGNSAQIGHITARKHLEKKLGITFSNDVKVKTRGGNWVFYQPIEKENKDVS